MYVDDLLIIGADKSRIDSFKDQLRARFKMTNLKLVIKYFRIEIKRDFIEIILYQRFYFIIVFEYFEIINYIIVTLLMNNEISRFIILINY